MSGRPTGKEPDRIRECVAGAVVASDQPTLRKWKKKLAETPGASIVNSTHGLDDYAWNSKPVSNALQSFAKHYPGLNTTPEPEPQISRDDTSTQLVAEMAAPPGRQAMRSMNNANGVLLSLMENISGKAPTIQIITGTYVNGNTDNSTTTSTTNEGNTTNHNNHSHSADAEFAVMVANKVDELMTPRIDGIASQITTLMNTLASARFVRSSDAMGHNNDGQAPPLNFDKNSPQAGADSLKSAKRQLNFSDQKPAFSIETLRELSRAVKVKNFIITHGKEGTPLLAEGVTMKNLEKVDGLCLTLKNIGNIRFQNEVNLSNNYMHYLVELLNPNESDFPKFTVAEVSQKIMHAGLNSLVEVTILGVALQCETHEDVVRCITDHFWDLGLNIIAETMSCDYDGRKVTFTLPSLFTGLPLEKLHGTDDGAGKPSGPDTASYPAGTYVGHMSGMKDKLLDRNGKTINGFGGNTLNLTNEVASQFDETQVGANASVEPASPVAADGCIFASINLAAAKKSTGAPAFGSAATKMADASIQEDVKPKSKMDKVLAVPGSKTTSSFSAWDEYEKAPAAVGSDYPITKSKKLVKGGDVPWAFMCSVAGKVRFDPEKKELVHFVNATGAWIVTINNLSACACKLLGKRTLLVRAFKVYCQDRLMPKLDEDKHSGSAIVPKLDEENIVHYKFEFVEASDLTALLGKLEGVGVKVEKTGMGA